MKKSLVVLFAFCICLLSCHYKTSNSNVSKFETRTIETFTSIDVSNAIEVEFTSSNEEAVSIGCSKEEALNKVITEVKNGVLKIYIESSFWDKFNNNNFRVIAKVAAKSITEVKVSGASSFNTTNTMSNENFNIESSGASSIKANIKSNIVKINSSGASSIQLTGNANAVELKASGASDIKNKNLEANKYAVDVSGASDVKIFAIQEVTGKLSGASSLKYSGNTANVQVNTSGASELEKD